MLRRPATIGGQAQPAADAVKSVSCLGFVAFMAVAFWAGALWIGETIVRLLMAG